MLNLLFYNIILSSLCGPSLKFLCWAPGYKNTEQTCSLTSIPPHTSLGNAKTAFFFL